MTLGRQQHSYPVLPSIKDTFKAWRASLTAMKLRTHLRDVLVTNLRSLDTLYYKEPFWINAKAYRFEVRQTVDQTITTGTWTIVNMDDELFDGDDLYELTDDEFIVPEDGVYLLQASAIWTNLATNGRHHRLRETTGPTVLVQSHLSDDGTGFNEGHSMSCIKALEKDQRVVYEVRHADGANRILRGSDGENYVAFKGVRLSPL